MDHDAPALLHSASNGVRVDRTWRERLRKEARLRTCSERARPTFQLNLANKCGSGGLGTLKHSHQRIELITEKEIKQSPQARLNAGGIDPESFEAKAIRSFGKLPKDRYELPELSTHDIGWAQAQPRCRSMGTRRRSSTPFGSRARWSSRPDCAQTTLQSSSASQSEETDDKFENLVTEEVVPLSGARSSTTVEDRCVFDGLLSWKWRRPRGRSDVTRYADTYVSLLRHNPFNQGASGRW